MFDLPSTLMTIGGLGLLIFSYIWYCKFIAMPRPEQKDLIIYRKDKQS